MCTACALCQSLGCTIPLRTQKGKQAAFPPVLCVQHATQKSDLCQPGKLRIRILELIWLVSQGSMACMGTNVLSGIAAGTICTGTSPCVQQRRCGKRRYIAVV